MSVHTCDRRFGKPTEPPRLPWLPGRNKAPVFRIENRAGPPDAPRMIHLDANGSTAMLPEVLEAMLPWLRDGHANPSGAYASARAARQAIDEARGQVAEWIGAEPDEIVFTGGGTESVNTALHSMDRLVGDGAAVVSAIEHRGGAALRGGSCAAGQIRAGESGRTIGFGEVRGPAAGRGDGFGDGGQQRDRRAPAGARSRPDGPRARTAGAHATRSNSRAKRT